MAIRRNDIESPPKRLIFWTLLVFSLALFLRLSYVATTVVNDPIRADALVYVEIAQNLIKYGVYAQAGQVANYFIPPGYPAFLAVLIWLTPEDIDAYWVVLILQSVLGACTAALVFLTVRRFMNLHLSLLAGGLTIVSPHLIVMTGYVLTETLFTFLLSLSIFVLLEGWMRPSFKLVFFAGLIIGMAGLVRPSIAGFPVFLVIGSFIFAKTETAKYLSIAYLVGLLFCTTGWLGWTNINQNSVRAPESLATKAFAFGIYPDLVYKDQRFRGYPYREDPNWDNFSSSYLETAKVLLGRFVEDPVKYAKWYLVDKALLFWSPTILVGMGDVYVYPVTYSLFERNPVAKAIKSVMQTIHPIILMLNIIGFLIGLWMVLKKDSKINPGLHLMATIVFSLLVYITLVHVVLAPLPRYSVPFRIPLYMSVSITIVLLCRFSFLNGSRLLDKLKLSLKERQDEK